MNYIGFSLSDIFELHKAIIIEFLPLQIIFLYFISYSFIGWVCECVYVSSLERRLINRGFLRGPLCPIYGCGGLLLNLFPAKIQETYLPLFFCTMFVCSVLEYLTSWYLEKTFHMKWWDYSQKKFNINGRVCLLNSVLFGLLGIFVLHFVEPLISYILSLLSVLATSVAANVIGVVFIIDLVTTVTSLVDFKSMLERMEDLNERISDLFANEKGGTALSLTEKFEATVAQLRLGKDERHKKLLKHLEEVLQRQQKYYKLFSHFPSASSSSHQKIISMWRAHFKKK